MHEPREACNVLLTICSDCKKEEKILIVTDTQSFQIAEELWKAAEEYPNKTLAMMDTKTMHGQEPSELIAAAMEAADVIFGATTYSLFHTNARRNATGNGARFVNMVDYTMSMLQMGGLYADIVAQGKVNDIVAENMVGSEIHLTAPNGTDLHAVIKGRPTSPQYARSLKAGMASSPPNVECAIAPIEETSNGVAVIDGSIPHPELGLIQAPIRITVKNGKIVEINGGEQAGILNKVMAGFEDPNAYWLGEIGVGMNPLCTLNGRMLEDEGAYGTVHLGFGSNISFGGIVQSACHLDMVIKNPTLTVDGHDVVKAGIVIGDETPPKKN